MVCEGGPKCRRQRQLVGKDVLIKKNDEKLTEIQREHREPEHNKNYKSKGKTREEST